MPNILRCAVALAVALAPAAASAQFVIGEPPMMMDEAMAPAGPMSEEIAVHIAMMNGVAVVEDVDHRFWDGNYEVEGTDMTGEDIEVTIDGMTGAIIEIDD